MCMHRRSVLAAAACAAIFPRDALFAQQRLRPFCRFSIEDGWSTAPPVSQYVTHRAGPNDRSGVPVVVDRIKQVLSFRNPIDILMAQDEDNAMATVAGGKRVLIIDVGFLQKLNRLSGTQWGAIQVIAHEVGHHIAGFTGDRHSAELNADYWSGQALQRLGSSPAAATSAILAVGTDEDTESHPNKRRRAQKILAGWEDARAGRIDYSHCQSCR